MMLRASQRYSYHCGLSADGWVGGWSDFGCLCDGFRVFAREFVSQPTCRFRIRMQRRGWEVGDEIVVEFPTRRSASRLILVPQVCSRFLRSGLPNESRDEACWEYQQRELVVVGDG
jgi:hypothetical protein